MAESKVSPAFQFGRVERWYNTGVTINTYISAENNQKGGSKYQAEEDKAEQGERGRGREDGALNVFEQAVEIE